MGKSFAELLGRASQGDTLSSLQDKIESIIERFDRDRALDPAFRSDIFTLLRNSTDVAEVLLDPTFPHETVVRQIADILDASSRLLNYVNNARPYNLSWGIMQKQTHRLWPPVFTSESEANNFVDQLDQAYGNIRRNVQVVPVRVTSQFAPQPRPRPPRNPAIIPPPSLGASPLAPDDEARDLARGPELNPTVVPHSVGPNSSQDMGARPGPLDEPPPSSLPEGPIESHHEMMASLDEIQQQLNEATKLTDEELSGPSRRIRGPK